MTTGDPLAATFAALTAEDNHVGYTPFRWQKRLLRCLIDGKLPKAVDIPTGLGKTAVMALWLIARAEGAKLPRRLVYVVDRRAVVDQATRFAEQLRRNMPEDMAKRLGLKNRALPISTLRGGFADNHDWLEDPSSPAIIVGTIDMIGSRLLFEGYGVSNGMRSYEAGFLGADSLVLLDEAHLCPPFEALLRQIETLRDGKLGPVPGSAPLTPPFHLMSLSATGREVRGISTNSVFRLTGQDYEEPVVHQRLTARKRLKVNEIEAADSLAELISARAIEFLDDDTPSRVLAYCHRRKDALEVKQLIDKACKKRARAGELERGCESELLVGERRVYEREELENWLERTGFLGGAKHPPRVPTFLVATSAGEVGVDLDADHMVCDLVPCERMVQRLGRVNRRGGEQRCAKVDVFAERPAKLKADASKAKREEYNQNLELFNRHREPLLQLPVDGDCRHDASPRAMVELKLSFPQIVEAATTPAPLYPELTRPLVDAWSMTSLKRHEGRPEVVPWLRGWEEDEEPHTDVIWRTYLPSVVRDSLGSLPPAMAGEFFRSAPIHATERLEAMSGRVFDWLLKRATQVGKRGVDHHSAVGNEEVVAIVLDRSGEHRAEARLGTLRYLAAPAKSMSKTEQRRRDRDKKEWKERHLPGAFLVVDARIGGVCAGMLDEKFESDAVAADANEEWRERKADPTAAPARPLIGFRIEEITGAEGEEGLAVNPALDEWRHIRTFETRFDIGGVARRGLAVYKWPDAPADEDSWSILSVPQTLTKHAEQVAARARDMARRLGLPDEEVEAFAAAARLHDDGKAAVRWQDAMNAPKDGRPYAKTCGGGNGRLLEGYRHEFGSLLKAERMYLPERTRDLILHLVAAHHGNARPLISTAGCEDGPPSLLESKAGDAALRFARLQKQYGPWGLAWREAILRAADRSVSREWDMQQGRDGGG